MKKSKEQKLIEFFERKRRITSWEAIIKFKLTRLSDIIFRLRRKGYIIETERQGKENFAIYRLIESADKNNKNV